MVDVVATQYNCWQDSLSFTVHPRLMAWMGMERVQPFQYVFPPSLPFTFHDAQEEVNPLCSWL